MPLSIEQLRPPMTEDQVLAFLLGELQSVGFNTSSWHSGSTRRNILQAVARTYSGATSVVTDTLNNVIVRPRGDWQDLIGKHWYKLLRLEAVKTERTVTLVSAPSSPPHSITDGSYLSTPKGVRFRVVGTHALGTGVTLPAVPVIAELAGIIGNVPASTAVATQVPAYSGVSVSFDGLPTVNGVERENDDRYQERCDRRFSELTYSVGLRAYELWALTAAPSVTRVRAINNYPDPNVVRIVLYPGEASEIAQVNAYIAGRHPPNDLPAVSAAAVVTQPIVATPRTFRGTTKAGLIALSDAAIALMPIGGWPIAGAVAGRFLREKITEAWLCEGGAQSAGLITPANDVVLGATDVVVATYDLALETAL